MDKKYISIIIINLILLFSFYDCQFRPEIFKRKFDGWVENELKVGDSSDKVEEFFNRHGISYSFYGGEKYKRYGEQVYQAICDDINFTGLGGDPSLAIRIYLNDEKRVERIEAYISRTVP